MVSLLWPISETHRPVCSCGAASVVHLQASDVFREGSNLIMFTSDVSARGMDYPEVSLVVQARPGPSSLLALLYTQSTLRHA